MEDAGCRAQFLAAVQVIQGLPRSGSYRPSYEEMLRFYSYYKQATAGRCEGPRPGFWDPIGRYKWDAWNSLGRMSKEEAMEAYVVEMKKVAQKSPARMTQQAAWLQSTKKMPCPESSRTSSIRQMLPSCLLVDLLPCGCTELQLPFGHSQTTAVPSSEPCASLPGGVLAPATALEGTQATSDSEGDVYCDTVEQMESEQAGQPLVLCLNSGQAGPEPLTPPGAGQGEQGEGRRLEGSSSTGSKRGLCLAGGKQDTESTPELSRRLVVELDACVASTVQALQDDMQQVLERLSELEILTSSQGDAAGTEPRQLLALQAPSPWPLTVSPHTLLFLVTWPFVTQWLLHRWQDRKR
ncbi:acyl-CoA-binding domain-containing protein 4 isoform X1 [Neopsephotus bourkii]|uniref:acyl-CoA-binding domain-containing protein 4 isoform X1 n=1 Tax=Neopsephotus bourkii TaxID=309878 RepID=UPI002AA57F3A|nr:acyl-CoA-binding domain-containing protein 4 isoform X1 [Neopsephotus bourkii]